MARITIEDCLEKIGNKFALSIAAMKRAKQLSKGAIVVASENDDNKHVVSALREIAEGKVDVIYPKDRDNY